MECKICKKIFSGSEHNPENFSRHVEACEKAQKKKYEKKKYEKEEKTTFYYVIYDKKKPALFYLIKAAWKL